VQGGRATAEKIEHVTTNPQLPGLGHGGQIELAYDAGTAYDRRRHHRGTFATVFVYKTTELYGKNLAVDHQPDSAPHADAMAHCVREDPVRKGCLDLGTEGGAYVSFDDGRTGSH